MDSRYSIRQLDEADWRAFRSMRLEALEREPGVFCASFSEQSILPDEYWRRRLADPQFAYFGLYTGDALIGISGIACNPQLPQEAELISSYIRTEFRQQGLSRLFYQSRIDWARAKGLQRLLVSHRESNVSSRQANQVFGFRFTHALPRLWHDGLWEDNVYYELQLHN